MKDHATSEQKQVFQKNDNYLTLLKLNINPKINDFYINTFDDQYTLVYIRVETSHHTELRSKYCNSTHISVDTHLSYMYITGFFKIKHLPLSSILSNFG